MIRLEGLTKRFGGRTVVDSVDLSVAAGEICVLIGPSGCGKTTTLKMVNRLIEPSAGRIVIGDEDVTSIPAVELRRRMGYVIQHVGLFPHRTVADNIATVPRLLGWDKARVKARVGELLELIGLPHEEYAKRYPHELSGGQRQRVGVARALGADPPVMLMDEPFGALDPIVRERLQDEFRRIQRTLGTTVVLVTHDLDEAVRLGDKVAILAEGGRLEQHDAPATLLAHPATPFVAQFLGADRGLRRLGVLTAGTVPLGPDVADADVPTVPDTASLRDALAALLTAGAPVVRVVAGATVLGTLTAESIREAAAD